MADDSEVSVSIGGKVDGSLGAAAQQAIGSVSSVSAAAQQASALTLAATRQMSAGFDQLAQEMQRTTLAVNLGFQKMAESFAQANSSMAATGGGARAAVAGMAAVQHASTGVRREMIVLAHELAMGNFTRLGGSLMVMAERMNGAGVAGAALAAAMSPLGLAVIAVTGATIGVGIAAEKGAEQFRMFGAAMAATNGYANQTRSSFESLAERLSASTHEGVGEAREALTRLANSGTFTGKQLELVGLDAINMGKMTGEGTEKALSYFEGMKSGVTKFALDYADHFHGITLAEYKHIEALEKAGDVTAAKTAMMEIATRTFGKNAAESVGWVTTALNGLRDTWNRFGNAVMQLGVKPTNAETIVKLQTEIAQISRSETDARGHVNAITAAHLAQLEKQLAVARQLEASDVKSAEAKAKAAAATTAEIDKYADTKEKKPKGMATEGDKEETELSDLLAKEKNWYGDREQITYDFWAHKVAIGHAGSALQDADIRKMNAAAEALDKAHYAVLLEQDREAVDDAKDSPAQLAASWTKYLADISAKQGQNSVAYIKAVHEQEAALEALKRKQEEVAAKAAEDAERNQIKGLRTGSETSTKGLDVKETQVQDDASVGLVSQKAALAQLQAIEAQKLAIANQEAQAELAVVITKENAIRNASGASAEQIEQSNKRVADEFQASQDRMTQAAQASADKIAQYQMQAAKKMQEAWRTDISSVVDTFGSGMMSMARGTGTFQQTMIHVAESVENIFLSMVEKMVTNWIMGLVQQTLLGGAQQKVTSLLAINDNAAVAASAAYAANIGVPIAGPALAAAAASAAYTQVELFSGLLSAAGGLDIGAGENPLIQAHAKEMVLPANLSDGFRQIIAERGGQVGGNGAGGGVSASPTYNTTIAPRTLDSRSFARWADNPQNVRAATRAFAKHG